MSPGLVSRDGGGEWGSLKLHVPFWGGFLLGGSNAEKWSDNRKEKFFINGSIEALIPFKEKH